MARFFCDKPEETGGLAPTKGDNAVRRKTDRRDGSVFYRFNYKLSAAFTPSTTDWASVIKVSVSISGNHSTNV